MKLFLKKLFFLIFFVFVGSVGCSEHPLALVPAGAGAGSAGSGSSVDSKSGAPAGAGAGAAAGVVDSGRAIIAVPKDTLGRVNHFCDVLSRLLLPLGASPVTFEDLEAASCTDPITQQSPLLQSLDPMEVCKELLQLVCGKTINMILDRLISDKTTTIKSVYRHLSLKLHPDKVPTEKLKLLVVELFKFLGNLKDNEWDKKDGGLEGARSQEWLKANLKFDTSRLERELKSAEVGEQELAARRQEADNAAMQAKLARLIVFNKEQWRSFLNKNAENPLLFHNVLLFFLRKDLSISTYRPVVILMAEMVNAGQLTVETAAKMLFGIVWLGGDNFASPVAKGADYVVEMLDFYRSTKQNPSDDIIADLRRLNKPLINYSLVMHPAIKEALPEVFSAADYINYFLNDANASLVRDLFFNKSLWELEAPFKVSLKNLECLARDKTHYNQLTTDFSAAVGVRLLDKFGLPEPRYFDDFITMFLADSLVVWLKENAPDKYYSLAMCRILLAGNDRYSLRRSLVRDRTDHLVAILSRCSLPTESFWGDQSFCEYIGSNFNVEQLGAVVDVVTGLFNQCEYWPMAFEFKQTRSQEYKWFVIKASECAPVTLIYPNVLNDIGTSRLFTADELGTVLQNIRGAASPQQWSMVKSVPKLASFALLPELSTASSLNAEGLRSLYAISSHYSACCRALEGQPDSPLKDYYRMAADAINFAYTTMSWSKVADPLSKRPSHSVFAAWLRLACGPEVNSEQESGLYWALHKSKEWIIPQLSSDRGLSYIKNAWESLSAEARTEELQECIAAIIEQAKPTAQSLRDANLPSYFLPEDIRRRLADEARVVDEARMADAERAAAEVERQRLVDEARLAAAAEQQRIVEEQRVAAAEQQRLADEARLAAVPAPLVEVLPLVVDEAPLAPEVDYHALRADPPLEPQDLVPATGRVLNQNRSGAGAALSVVGAASASVSVIIMLLRHNLQMKRLEQVRDAIVMAGQDTTVVDKKIAQHRATLIPRLAAAGLLSGAIGAGAGYALYWASND